MAILGLLLSASLFIGAINAQLMTSSNLAWLVAVLMTEFAHWFVIACLIALVFSGSMKSYRTPTGALSMLMIAAAIPFYMRPWVSALAHESAWRADIQRVFPDVSPEPLSFPQLFWPRDIGKIQPQKIQLASGQHYEFFRTTKDKAPLLVIVHGGGWESGKPDQLPELSRMLATKGIAVASVSYRLAPDAKWPAQSVDVEAAVNDIRSRAQEFNIDPDRWALLGRSAGGQIAGAIAYTTKIPGLKSLVSLYAPTDLTFGYEVADANDWLESRRLIEGLMGARPLEAPAAFKTASVTENVSPQSVPTLILHGSPDSLCWVKHADRLKSRLDLAGVRAVSIEMPWGHHGFDFSLNGPGGQTSTAAISAFLEATL